MPSLSHEYLKRILNYDPLTGNWTWNEARQGIKAGQRAGSPNVRTGRLQIKIDGKRYYSARLAWFYMTGEFPTDLIDHRNRDPTDDRWENLRPANNLENLANRKGWAKSGLPPGITVRRNKKKNQFRVDFRDKYIGYFSSVEEASEVYVKLHREYYGDFSFFKEI